MGCRHEGTRHVTDGRYATIVYDFPALSTKAVIRVGHVSRSSLNHPDAEPCFPQGRAMKPFSRLFRKTPPSPPPTLEQRITSLQVAPTEVVVNTALGNDDASLRVGAIRLLPDGAALRSLAGLADPSQGAVERTPPAVRQAAHERLAQLVDEGSIDFAAFCSGQEHGPESMTVAALCKDPDRLRQMLARIDDPAVLARLARESPSSRVRQSAAAAIDDPAQLHDLLPWVRGKDKTVYKLIKQKCDALVAEQRKAEESAREAEALCASLERHSEKPHDPLYAATLEVLTARWRALATHPNPAVEQRGQQAIERCGEVIAAHERELARQAAEQAAEREARAARERALEVEQRAAAEQAEAEARALAEATAAHESEEHARAAQQAAEAQALREIGGLIRLARVALQAGNTRKAARFRQAIEDGLQAAPAVPTDLTRSLQLLDEKLNELRQWKDYVAAPKRIELIEEMEALVGSQEDPATLAEHVRALQQEWRTINKGIASDTSADAQRFQQAFQSAFKPCQEYFATQAAIRRENLEARKRVLERLKTFEASQAGEHADYGLIAQVLREAPREWRSHSPVDREAGRSTEIHFYQAMDLLRRILNAWYERNEAEKKSLISQARHLSTVEDSTQAIDGVKRLHALWKETGPVPRDQAQVLWDEFRALCDAVYERREQAYVLHSAGLEAAKASAVALCEQVEQAGSVSAEERLAARAKIREWHAAFDGLQEMPRADARGLRDRFERAVSRYEAGLAQRDLRDAEAAESNLLEAGRYIRAYERAVMQDAPPAEREALRHAADAFMAGVPRWPKGGLPALKQALARADSASAPDDEARENALRTLCIRWEVLSSTPTPPEDGALRRDYQMRLLMEGLGQASHTDERDWDAMLLEWIGIGAIAPEAHEDLQRRFIRCLAKRPAKSPRESPFQSYEPDRAPGSSRSRGRR
jgi:ribosome modulation factor